MFSIHIYGMTYRCMYILQDAYNLAVLLLEVVEVISMVLLQLLHGFMVVMRQT